MGSDVAVGQRSFYGGVRGLNTGSEVIVFHVIGDTGAECGEVDKFDTARQIDWCRRCRRRTRGAAVGGKAATDSVPLGPSDVVDTVVARAGKLGDKDEAVMRSTRWL